MFNALKDKRGMPQLNIPIKTCKNCGEIFVTGYHASVGIQFWWTALTFIGGIVYWAVRGRSEKDVQNVKDKNLMFNSRQWISES